MSVNFKELAYYLFFGLMIAAKGIGLDSGDRLYYIISLLAVICIFVKLMVTEYNWKELSAIGALGLIAFIAYCNSGRMGILLSVLAITGSKDIRLSKLFQIGAVIYITSFLCTILGAVSGIISNPFVVHEKGGIGEIIRWGMGYSTGNVFHISYFIFVVFIVYNIGHKFKLKYALWLMSGNVLVFIFSLSYTGVSVTAFYLLISLYAAGKRQPDKALQLLCLLVFPACLLFSFLPPFILNTGIGQKLNELLQARPAFSYYYLVNQPVTLFGTRMRDIPNFWIIMDNGYVYILMTFGIIIFLLFCAGYIGCIWRCLGIGSDREGSLAVIEFMPMELAIIFSFLIYGIMEQFISNAFMNLSLFFVGQYFFTLLKTGHKTRLQNSKVFSQLIHAGKRRVRLDCFKGFKLPSADRKIWFWIIGIGLGFVMCYELAGEKNVFITVPITAVNYIDAQSALIPVEPESDSKEELRQLIEGYELSLKDTVYLQGLLDSLSEACKGTESGDEISTFTPQRLIGIMEFSIPQYVQKNKSYGAFRIRLFESYCDISEETYKILLSEMISRADIPKTDELEIYSERIGKSFGEERIEHIKDSGKYFVEKSGSVASAENFRERILFALFGAAAGCILYFTKNTFHTYRIRLKNL